MRVFVTGISGFVGCRLAEHLRQQGDDVGGSYAEVKPPDLPSVRLYRLDLLEGASLAAALDDFAPEVLIHLAGLSDVGASWQRMDEYFRVNVIGTENLLDRAGRDCRVVFASSAEVYGRVPPSEQPIRETAELRPRTPYGLTKAAAERLAQRAGAIVARSFNLVGPGQSPRFALPSFAGQLAAIARGEEAPVLRVGDLSSLRDFVHVDDGAEAYRLLAAKGERGAVYNVASGQPVSVQAALDQLLVIAGVEVRVETDPERLRPADVGLVSGDNARLRSLGWQPRRGLGQALADLWQWTIGAAVPRSS